MDMITESIEKRIPTGVEKFDIVIIGAGPAGLAAGIYSARSGLNCIVLEKGTAGGQGFMAPWIENYPGFSHIEGSKLMEQMSAHAQEYVEIREGSEVVEIEPLEENFRVKTAGGEIESRGIILAMGAVHRRINISGENEYAGRGVSYCATCDGFFFKDKKVAVIGGGNTAVTDALYLNSIGCDVTLIHRRNELRASKHLQKIVSDKNIRLVLSTVAEKIIGGEDAVSQLEIKNVVSGETSTLDVDGVFIAIGTMPNSSLAKSLKVHMNEGGFLKVGRDHRTNIPFVYAAGDIVGGILQIVAAVHGGAVAALSAFEDLADPYYVRTRKI